jgi:hypothetical protein
VNDHESSARCSVQCGTSAVEGDVGAKHRRDRSITSQPAPGSRRKDRDCITLAHYMVLSSSSVAGCEGGRGDGCSPGDGAMGSPFESRLETQQADDRQRDLTF